PTRLFSLTSPLLPRICSPSLHDALPIFPRFFNLNGKRSLFIHRATNHFVPFRFFNWNGFTCQHRFINRRVSIHNRTVNRKLGDRSEEHTSELQSRFELVCRLLLEKKNQI